MKKDGRLFRTWKSTPGQAKLMGYLEDYAFYADGLLALYQSTFEPRWFREARALTDIVLAHFPDEAGGFFDTADDHEQLVTRPQNLQDNAMPSGNSMAVRVLLYLTAYTGQAKYERPASKALRSLQGLMSKHPGAFAHWLGALEFNLAPPQEIAVIGPLEREDTNEMLDVLLMPYRPNQVVAVTDEDDLGEHPELVQERPAQNGHATAYVCQNFTCQQPVTTAEDLATLLTQ
jgi:uncharacterized protein YyaL (SSP411 family)